MFDFIKHNRWWAGARAGVLVGVAVLIGVAMATGADNGTPVVAASAGESTEPPTPTEPPTTTTSEAVTTTTTDPTPTTEPTPVTATMAEPSPAEGAPTTEPLPVEGNEDHGGRLWGRSFLSVSVTERDLPSPLFHEEQVEVTFEYRDGGGMVLWDVNCNYQGGTVSIGVDRLDVGEVGGTAASCGEVNDARERWLMSFFGSDPYWALDGTRLTLTSGDRVIELEEAPPS